MAGATSTTRASQKKVLALHYVAVAVHEPMADQASEATLKCCQHKKCPHKKQQKISFMVQPYLDVNSMWYIYIYIELIIIVDRHLMVIDGHFTRDGPRGNVTDKLSWQSLHARRSLQVSKCEGKSKRLHRLWCHSIGCFHYCYVIEPDAAKSRA